MKIKGSVKSLNITASFIVFALGTAAALGLRIYQAVSGLIDFSTGFYTSEHVSTYIMYLVLVVAGVAIFSICFLCGEVPQDKMPSKKSPAMTLVSGLFAIAMAVVFVECKESFTSVYNSYDPFSTQASTLSYLMKSGALPQLGEAVFAALSIVYFLVLLLKYSGLSNVSLTKIKFFAVCPLFWATFRMVARFTRTISFMNVSGLLLELFMIAFMMLFFMYMAQMSAEVNNIAISYKVYAYGLIGAMFAAVVSLPRVFMLIYDENYRQMFSDGYLECTLEVGDIAFIAFAVVLLVLCLSSPRIKNMTQKETLNLIDNGEEE